MGFTNVAFSLRKQNAPEWSVALIPEMCLMDYVKRAVIPTGIPHIVRLYAAAHGLTLADLAHHADIPVATMFKLSERRLGNNLLASWERMLRCCATDDGVVTLCSAEQAFPVSLPRFDQHDRAQVASRLHISVDASAHHNSPAAESVRQRMTDGMQLPWTRGSVQAKSFAELIAVLAHHRSWNANEVALISGVNVLFVTNTLNGLVPLPVERWERIIAVLGLQLRVTYPRGSITCGRMKAPPKPSEKLVSPPSPHIDADAVTDINVGTSMPIEEIYRRLVLGDPINLVASLAGLKRQSIERDIMRPLGLTRIAIRSYAAQQAQLALQDIARQSVSTRAPAAGSELSPPPLVSPQKSVLLSRSPRTPVFTPEMLAAYYKKRGDTVPSDPG